MMLWSDNNTQHTRGNLTWNAQYLATHSVSAGKKKNLLTFSATTNACLKQKQKNKKGELRVDEYHQGAV